MVDEVRRGTAEQLLQEGKTSIPDVAFLLGFSDVTTFTRAFKRWCGVPPGKFRERASGGQPGEVEGQEGAGHERAGGPGLGPGGNRRILY